MGIICCVGNGLWSLGEKPPSICRIAIPYFEEHHAVHTHQIPFLEQFHTAFDQTYPNGLIECVDE
jgi:hypothetical protein